MADDACSSSEADKCPVCLNPFTFPVELKCKHRLCFLCLKGVGLVNHKCPLCRKNITKRFLDKPKFVEGNNDSNSNANEGDFKWFYKGGNGWWLYDKETNDYIENAYSSNQPDCRITVVGNCYTINFNDMMQYRDDLSSKKRRVKRDVYKHIDDELKGLAGISKSQLESIAGKRKVNDRKPQTARRTRRRLN